MLLQLAESARDDFSAKAACFFSSATGPIEGTSGVRFECLLIAVDVSVCVVVVVVAAAAAVDDDGIACVCVRAKVHVSFSRKTGIDQDDIAMWFTQHGPVSDGDILPR